MPPYVKDLTFSYSKQQTVFAGFTFSPTARISAILGPSGAGKTTLLKLLSGDLLPDACAAMSSTEGACLILQEDALLPWLTGISNITTFASVPTSRLECHPLFSHVQPFLVRRACEMSFGQRRMIELLRAVLLAPPLLLLDEPFNFLDPEKRSAVASVLASDEMAGTSLVLSTHHTDELAGLSASSYRFSGGIPVRQLVAA